MSNLLKSFSLVCREDKCIIDSNDAVTLKLQQIRHMVTEGDSGGGFSLGINPENVEHLLGEDNESTNEMTARAKDVADSIIAEANSKAKSIVEAAESTAAKVLEDAKNESDNIKSQAYNEGIEAGKTEGRQFVSDEHARLEAEYKDKLMLLNTEYQEKMKQMEPELVDVMLDVFGSITRVLSEDYREMILALVDKVLNQTDTGNNYIIRVCREDAEFLRKNKENLLQDVNRDVNIEIVEDLSMKRNECLIDTDLGVYDCGLDIQLENLSRAIRVLACTTER